METGHCKRECFNGDVNAIDRNNIQCYLEYRGEALSLDRWEKSGNILSTAVCWMWIWNSHHLSDLRSS